MRLYESRDFTDVVTLIQRSPGGGDTIKRLMPLLTDGNAVAVVAHDGATLVGVAAGTAAGGTGWIVGAATHDDDTLVRLVDAVEAGLAERGVGRVVVVVRAGAALERRGYQAAGLEVYERSLAGAGSHDRLARLGGRMIDSGLWDDLKGMDEPKEIIERRVILPLAEPELARRHGVAQPKAIVLFGPPGTGKTTFESAKPTLTPEMIDEFRTETERFKRA